jgi:ketosteroid isomerase-like protein
MAFQPLSRTRRRVSLVDERPAEVVRTFDFTGYRDAVAALDVERWLAFYAPDAEWREYRQANPPRAPHLMRGAEEIGAFLCQIAASELRLTIDNELVDARRAAYTLTVTLADGSRIIENVILAHRDGLITDQIDVEAWD